MALNPVIFLWFPKLLKYSPRGVKGQISSYSNWILVSRSLVSFSQRNKGKWKLNVSVSDWITSRNMNYTPYWYFGMYKIIASVICRLKLLHFRQEICTGAVLTQCLQYSLCYYDVCGDILRFSSPYLESFHKAVQNWALASGSDWGGNTKYFVSHQHAYQRKRARESERGC